MKPMQGTLVSTKPVMIWSAKAVNAGPDDYGIKMSIRKYTEGYELCRYKAATQSSIRVVQALFGSIIEAQKWASQQILGGEKFDV